jgi:hypothetical protein
LAQLLAGYRAFGFRPCSPPSKIADFRLTIPDSRLKTNAQSSPFFNRQFAVVNRRLLLTRHRLSTAATSYCRSEV